MSRILAILVVLAAGSAWADAETVETTPKAQKAGAKDPNIKSDSQKNSRGKAAPAPPDKGGKTRGSGPYGCKVTVANWTGYFVKVFIDGESVGTLSPYDDGSRRVGNGSTALYARADYDDGTFDYWGPMVVNCEAGGSRTWNLKP